MEKLLKRVYSSHKLSAALFLSSYAIVLISVAAYWLLLWGAFTISALSALKLFIITALPFLMVTLLRNAVNAPRPYELYDFYEHRPKKGLGRSFPSRHAFSIFSIATAAMFIYPIMGSVLLVLGVWLCVARVLTGIHFIRDVSAGAIIGAVSSIVGILTTNPF